MRAGAVGERELPLEMPPEAKLGGEKLSDLSIPPALVLTKASH